MAIPSSVVQVNNQNFQPLGQRRKFDAEEQAAIDKGLSQALPKIGAGFGTPLPELLASPKIAAAAGGIGLGTIGGILGAFLPDSGKARVVGFLIGGPVLGALTAAGLFVHRNQQNNTILDSMARLPKGATQRDMLADPVLQQEKQLEAMKTMARAMQSTPRSSNEPSLSGDLIGALLKASAEKKKADEKKTG